MKKASKKDRDKILLDALKFKNNERLELNLGEKVKESQYLHILAEKLKSDSVIKGTFMEGNYARVYFYSGLYISVEEDERFINEYKFVAYRANTDCSISIWGDKGDFDNYIFGKVKPRYRKEVESKEEI